MNKKIKPIPGIKRDPKTGLLPEHAPPHIAKQARELAEEYQIVVWKEDGRYYGEGIELPDVMGDGKTPETCIRQTRKAFVVVVETMLMLGKLPPTPARQSDEARTEQVNVRLAKREKSFIEAAAKSRGFKGLADYVRSCALRDAQSA